MDRLANKVAFITGIAGGQGRAAALLFASEGAHIVGCDIKEHGVQETVALVEAQGGSIDGFYPVDLADAKSAGQWIKDGVAKAGRIDILYNNASAVEFRAIPDLTEASWSFSIGNELTIIFNAVTAAWPIFQSQKHGVIINTASISAHRGDRSFGQLAHCAAKGGVVAMTRQLAAEGAAERIRANSISPGTVITPGSIAALSPEKRAMLEQVHPIGRAGQPEDIAYCALYLASDEAGWVTGSDFVIDGGLSSILF